MRRSRRKNRGRNDPGRATSARSADSFRGEKGRSKNVKKRRKGVMDMKKARVCGQNEGVPAGSDRAFDHG